MLVKKNNIYKRNMLVKKNQKKNVSQNKIYNCNIK